jgi:hypothetical protein
VWRLRSEEPRAVVFGGHASTSHKGQNASDNDIISIITGQKVPEAII